MASSRDRRLAKELADLQADNDGSGIYASSVDGVTLTKLLGILPAPPDSPYAGAKYEIEIDIPENYPFKSPLMRFKTRIWHPNISSATGAICLDTLGSGWSPVQTVKTALLSLRLLLDNPNPKDPQDAEVAKMLMEDPERFARKAQEWAVKYAGAPSSDMDMSKWKKDDKASGAKEDDLARYRGYHKDLVARFTNMGFSVEQVVDAFAFVGIDRNGGQDYELEEAYMGDITARLLGEP